jgi:peptidoglycan/xylan/chitin deacetylase (PgdA/CDA1 family)
MRMDRAISLALCALQPSIRTPLIVVLMYHSISVHIENRVHPYFKTVTSPDRFAQQMQWLSEQNAEVVSIDNWNLPFSGNKLLRVIITFDDGFADFLPNALPVLQAKGYPATMFLPTDFIHSGRELIAGVKHLGWNDICQLLGGGISIGSHSVSHRHLETLTRNEIYNEVRFSAERIKNYSGAKVTSFSCPYAFPQENAAVVTSLRESLIECGYQQAVTTRIGTVSPGDNPYTLRRLPVNSGDDKKLFIAKLNAGYNWLGRMQEVVRFAKKHMHRDR